ncbi:transposase, MuDR, MULE transposase domain protein [Tanacetum coccineum]
MSQHLFADSIYGIASYYSFTKERGDRAKNKVKNTNLSPLNLGNAFANDNVGDDDVMFLGGRFTGNYLCYDNMDRNKENVTRGQYIDCMEFLSLDPHDIYIDCYMRGYSVEGNFWSQLVPHLFRDSIDNMEQPNQVGWLPEELRARLWNNTAKYHITHLYDVHTCPKTQTYPNHRNANKKVIAHIITPKLQENKRVLRGKAIQQDIMAEYEVNLSYQQAWRGKDYGIEHIRGSPYESFEMLSYYCHNLERKNPGTVTRIKTDEKGVFEMLFIAIGASIRTFINYLRPLLIIDAAHLKGTYKGTNLVAVGMDGNNQIVPIAFGICKGETGPCWSWWIFVLKECIADNRNLLFISDRHHAIAMAVRNEFPLAFHAAYTHEDFATNMSILQAVQPDAYYKLCEAGVQRWSRAHCPLVRYNYMTSNSVESVNACSVINRKLPVLKLAETYRAMVQDWYYKRRQLAANMKYEITDWAAHKSYNHFTSQQYCETTYPSQPYEQHDTYTSQSYDGHHMESAQMYEQYDSQQYESQHLDDLKTNGSDNWFNSFGF